MTYRYLPHTADIKVAIEGNSFAELLADGLLVTRQLLAGDHPVQPREERRLQVEGPDAAETFLDFLREVLFLHATDAFLPSTFLPDTIEETAVGGVLAGEPFDAARHEHQPEVKAVTRHGLVRLIDGTDGPSGLSIRSRADGDRPRISRRALARGAIAALGAPLRHGGGTRDTPRQPP